MSLREDCQHRSLSGKVQNVASFGIRKGGGAGGRAALEKFEARQRFEARAAKALALQAGNAPSSRKVSTCESSDVNTFLTEREGRQEERQDMRPEQGSCEPGATTPNSTLKGANPQLRAALHHLAALMKRRESEFEASQKLCQQEHAKVQRNMCTIGDRIGALEREYFANRSSFQSDINVMSESLVTC
mmetsp:Transcript_45068/g.70342  ORF Transcript_45068/g.70342 Transcript_45068/m.70342 type:complete len:188 (+) Transcript_45068:35-598(+)